MEEEYRCLRKFRHDTDDTLHVSYKKYFLSFISKVLICCILYIVLLIVVKLDVNYQAKIYDVIYDKHFSFTQVNQWYHQYFGDFLPFDTILPDDTMVFSEKLVYKEANIYKDGVKLSVDENYLVPILESGLVIFIGEKEDYGKSVMIQQTDGLTVLYGNVNLTDIQMYDYVEKGAFLGEAIENELFLVFEKEGEYLDYKKYI